MMLASVIRTADTSLNECSPVQWTEIAVILAKLLNDKLILLRSLLWNS